MATFESYLPTLLLHEGGFVNDPADPGGATNKGVTMKTFRGCAQRLLGVAPTLTNLKALTPQQAATVYKELYWKPIRADEIRLQELANIVFDFYVNAGDNATNLLQNTLNSLGRELVVDGKVGAATMSALAIVDQKEVYRRYKLGRAAYYRKLAERDPQLKKFLKGWLNRVNSFPDL
jgi:lysozyme family protein